MKLERFLYILQKYSDIKCHENPSCGSRIVPCGRTDGWTDIMWLIVAFSNFGKTPKNMQRGKFKLIIRIITALPTFSQTILKDILNWGPQRALS